jgi:hypothetical protein
MVPDEVLICLLVPGGWAIPSSGWMNSAVRAVMAWEVRYWCLTSSTDNRWRLPPGAGALMVLMPLQAVPDAASRCCVVVL